MLPLYFPDGMIKRFINILIKSVLERERSFFMMLFLIICTFAVSFLSVIHIYNSPYNFKEKEITIIKGTSTWEALSRLHREGVLPFPLIIVISSILERNSTKIVAGDYLFKPDMSPREVLRMLSSGKVIEWKITFPEGLTSYEILTQINSDLRLTGITTSNPPEGSLFPSTYSIRRNHSRQSLLRDMTTTMERVTKELIKTNTNPFIKTPSQLITFASILEKEAATPEELPRIAGIFVNRLKKRMRLQSCPTVIYARTLGKKSFSRMLTYEDLGINSDYNTYRREGLPVGPICCPGLEALKAAARPMVTNELFFIFDGKKHHFSVTYKEHLEHRRRIRNIETFNKTKAADE